MRWERLVLTGTLLLAWAGPAGAGHPAAPAPSALEPPATGGLATVDRALAKLTGHRRLLVIGAHPDDEDTNLLALVAAAMGGEAAYLSLSRGEGGQNLVGPELGEGLGLLRTGELMAARRLEGSRQFFTRAFDFGYTRSLEETLERWPKEALLEDGMRVVRRFKPQVIASVFPSDGRAGHGQHQAAGVVARELFDLSRVPDRFAHLTAEGLPPWSPEVLFHVVWWRPEDATLKLPLGIVDPITGRSVRQLAAASRSMHRSQDMGRLQELGAREDLLARVEGGEEGELFGGIDTRMAALAASLPDDALRARVEARLTGVERRAREARRRLSPVGLEEMVPELAALLDDLRGAAQLVAAVDQVGARITAALVDEKIAVAEAALAAAAGLALDVWSEQASVALGGGLEVEVQIWNSGSHALEIDDVTLISAEGWRSSAAADPAGVLGPGELRAWKLPVEVPGDAAPTLPYFLRAPRVEDLYDWTGVASQVRGEPLQPPPLSARVALRVAGTPLTLEREVVQRYGDQAVGEVRRPLRAVPELEVAVEPGMLVWPTAGGERRELEVTLISRAERPLAGRLEVRAPAGWPAMAALPFAIPAPRGRASLRLELEAPETRPTGVYRLALEAVLDGGARFAAAYPLVDYPHVRPLARRVPAEVEVRAFELDLPPVERIGYVRGASDRVPEMLLEVGLPVELLSAADLERRELDGFDAIVVGSRAYETDPDLGRANGRLLEWVRNGGLLIVQYQQYQFTRGGFAPFPLEIDRPHGRVTDEGAPVTILEPAHPLFVRPNPIAAADWEGWVQERGLYFAGDWDDAYTPLLALADAGREEERGALLVARHGEGLYVYTGLSFFRQLPAGVPGAFRLFANLLGLQP